MLLSFAPFFIYLGPSAAPHFHRAKIALVDSFYKTKYSMYGKQQCNDNPALIIPL